MTIDLARTNGSSPPAGELDERIRVFWQRYFPTIELVNTHWFEKYDSALLDQSFRITAEKIKAGRFKVLDEKNIGKYAVGVIRRLTDRWCIPCEVWIEADYRISEKDKERFESQLVRSGDCLLFIGARTTGGYRKFWVNGRSIGAHFFAYFSQIGYLPAANALGGANGLQVAHSCSNRLCCSPRHLRLTTKKVNLAERLCGFIDRLRDVVNGDYGSTNGSVPSRSSHAVTEAYPEQSYGEPLSSTPVVQTQTNKELAVNPSSGRSSSRRRATFAEIGRLFSAIFCLRRRVLELWPPTRDRMFDLRYPHARNVWVGSTG